jgi:hypothetical protein
MTWTKDTIGTASYTKDAIGSASYTNDAVGSASYTKDSGTPSTTYLLMEDGYRLLQEDGSPIVLNYGTVYSKDAVGSGTYTNDAK